LELFIIYYFLHSLSDLFDKKTSYIITRPTKIEKMTPGFFSTRCEHLL